MPRKSIQRLTQVIKEKAAHVLLHEIKDPRMGFVTVTRVDLTDDLSYVTVYYSVLGTDVQRRLTAAAMNGARGYVQRRIGENLRTRSIPHLTFEFDQSVVGQMKMSALLQDLRDERGDETPEAEGDAEAKPGDAPPSDDAPSATATDGEAS